MFFDLPIPKATYSRALQVEFMSTKVCRVIMSILEQINFSKK